MSFNLGLDVLLSVGDQSNELRRHLIQAFMDYGCSTDDLDNLLRDCRERRELLNGLAKKVAGPIWEQAEVSVSLEVDFAISGDSTLKFEFPLVLVRIVIRHGLEKSHEVRASISSRILKNLCRSTGYLRPISAKKSNTRGFVNSLFTPLVFRWMSSVILLSWHQVLSFATRCNCRRHSG